MTWSPSKKLIALGLYEGGYLRVLFDPRNPDAVVPPFLRESLQAAFDYGAALAKPTDDAVIDDEGIQATLSFNQEPFFTKLPWSSIFCMLSPSHGTVAWPTDVPAAVADDHMKRKAYEAEPTKAKEPEKKPRPAWLKAVD